MDARESEYSDVIIVGAGFSGIGAAYRIREKNPDLTFTILERRERLGGTWDLFRYPGIRSDSDIFTLSFPWEPWTRPEAIADGPDIWQYMADAARKHGIDRHIRYQTEVRSADWDSATDTWTVRADHNGTENVFTARFLFFASGYYDYSAPYAPDFPGLGDFRGEVIHPQLWPEEFDTTGKRLVVIGSGATAVSMIPSLASKAAHVTMLQRTPSYLFSVPRVLPPINAIRRVLPGRTGHLAARWVMSMFGSLLWLVSRGAPALSKRLLRWMTKRELPANYPVDIHFRPPYDPWDQRMCFMVDADLLKAVAAGDVEIVTDHVDHFDAHGVVLRSGRRLDADAVITATGLQMQALGGAILSVDGEKVEPHQRFMYRRHLLEDVPNAAWCMGYTNASWTLGADMTARAVANLLAYMNSHGYTHAYPHLGNEAMGEQPAFNLKSGYVLRGLSALPKSGIRRPWMLSHTYVRDAIGQRLESIEESMVFGRAGEREAHPA
ncbi:FAD-dependent oxidoreductase [Mycolicibacterium chubuense]|uniref:FAD-containing monooxygenase EthA n=1 Tax=Mycolicibacterium chubuense TaxID=1800 RepID=A0A0J6WPW0_MYCCU|nr:NAD(P)/FAD-dependent oxidoreductase [Mycolicibacterium chubuense]KMO84589.1 FAD-containing monooxygenase EthA [Mycolicibacterium chubuense]ORA45906.1 FAD-dependent oxidoreductase [Mycolicibacterium chubuense]SPY00642.1 putative flavoprotein involved in K+ transport [Mycolicibacterium chubuense]